MSWKPEYRTTSDGGFADNALRFETEHEALANARDLMSRWLLVRSFRVVQSDDPVNYRWIDGRLEDAK